MNNSFHDYLALLEEMRTGLVHLTELENQKAAAVRGSDLIELDRIIKLEQASTLMFRGLEQKKEGLMQTLNLKHSPLSALPAQFPSELRMEARQTVEKLQTQYKRYNASAEVARNTLECSLHEIDKILAGHTPTQGPGYTAPAPDLPPKMKTDFRA